jgi:ribosome-associated toxin RatA of RatAB toxin-antitoxin module
MYELVNAVQSYPDFLPWCDSSEVHEQDASAMLATVAIAKGGINKSFTTRNQLLDGQSIHMQLVDGPFSKLEGLWKFEPLGPEACKISLDLNFDFDSPVLRASFSKIFDQIAGSMVDAFVLRANQTFGSSKSG